MAIKKNSAAAAAEPEAKKTPAQKAAATKAAAKAPAAKEAPKAVAKAKPEPAPEAEAAVAKVTRKDLAAIIQEKVKAAGKAVPSSIAEIMVVAYEEAVAESLGKLAEVNLPGFGKFIPVQKEEAEKRNPATGEMVLVPAHIAVRFKVGSKLKAAANGGAEAGDDEAEAAE